MQCNVLRRNEEKAKPLCMVAANNGHMCILRSGKKESQSTIGTPINREMELTIKTSSGAIVSVLCKFLLWYLVLRGWRGNVEAIELYGESVGLIDNARWRKIKLLRGIR
jgi:hypothetical protein